MKRLLASILVVCLIFIAGCAEEQRDAEYLNQPHTIAISLEQATERLNATLEAHGENKVKAEGFSETTLDDGTRNVVAQLKSGDVGDCGLIMIGDDKKGAVDSVFVETYGFDDENLVSAILDLVGLDKKQLETVLDLVFDLGKEDTRSENIFGLQFHAIKHMDDSGNERKTRTISAKETDGTPPETEARSRVTNDFAAGTQKYESLGISCDIPSSWEKIDLNNGNDYFYPQVENTTTFFMVSHAEMSASILDKTMMDNFAVEMERAFTSVTRLKCEEAENKAGYQHAVIDLEGELNGASGRLYNAIFDTAGGITAIGLFQQDTCAKDFYEDFMRIVDTVQISKEPAADEPPEEDQTSVPPVSEKTEEPEKPVATETMGQKNALAKAKDYLAFAAFSHSGLIGQLEYEGFSTEDATYAADKCGADWNAQAARKAQDYLDFTSFSRSGLIDQLLYEGFTQEQAEYGVTAVGY